MCCCQDPLRGAESVEFFSSAIARVFFCVSGSESHIDPARRRAICRELSVRVEDGRDAQEVIIGDHPTQ